MSEGLVAVLRVGLVMVASVLLMAGPAAHAAPSQPPRCVVVPSAFDKPAASGSVPAMAQHNVVVTVPRLRCTGGPNPQGGGNGGAVHGVGGGNAVSGSGTGKIPFTGLDVEKALARALVLLLTGGCLTVVARPRRPRQIP